MKTPFLLVRLFLCVLPIQTLFCEEEIAPESPPTDLQAELPPGDESLTASFFNKKSDEAPPSDKATYTINYDTVPIVEYIRFASKICNVNFIFNEAELNFTVTVVSEGPITPENVMATLVQILRIHGLQLIEQGNNLVIHTSDNVKQIATLFPDKGNGTSGKAPIVTRIFRLQNVKADSMAAIVRPMISSTAILETSAETRQIILTDVTANVDKVALLIENLDSSNALFDIKSFEAVHNKPDYLISIATQLMAPIAQGNPFILVPANLSNVIFIVSTPELSARGLQILESLDVPPKKSVLSERKIRSENIFVYKLENRSGDEVLSGLTHIADNLEQSGVPEPDLLETIDAAKWIRETNAIMIVGSKESVDKVRELIMSLDVPTPASLQKANFFVYKPINRSAGEVYTSIRELAQNLKGAPGTDPALIATIESAKINSATQTVTFSGEERTFARVRELLATVDLGKSGKGSSRNNFFIYQLKARSANQIESALKAFAKDLDKSNADNEGLSRVIEGMKYIRETHSILFAGSDASLKRLQEILPTFDTEVVPSNTKFFIYKPKFQKGAQLAASLRDVADNLRSNELADPTMLHTLDSLKWVKSTNSLLFTGDPDSIAKVEALIATLDTQGSSKGGYYIYKLQNASSGKEVEEDLERLAQELKKSGMSNSKVPEAIEHIRYIKETNSFLITGDQETIDEIKDMISRYDTLRTGAKTNYFMYKPQNMAASALEQAMREVAKNLQSADLADPALLSSIASMQYSDTTESLIFTGTPDALKKLEAMIKEIDLPPSKQSSIQKVGKTTYLLYKLKNATSSQITASIKAISTDLKKSGNADKDFLHALGTMKYVRDTNSLMFTGSPDSLTKVEALIEKFDIPGAGGLPTGVVSATATNFYVYKPQALAGPDLEKLMQDFAENLRQTGLSDPDLFNTITSMRWVEKTSSLLFTGSLKSIEQVKELLREFDIPSNLPSGGPIAPGAGASIQSIDNTSFLVYKLQFHKGEEIQNALRQIAKDLLLSSAPANQALLNSINSVQWLEVTNSLLCSGDPETLTRLRELLKNLDIPLKQVFIEMLVLQTSLTNALTFGLEWGAKYKYQNKFSGTVNNLGVPSGFTPGSTTTTYPLNEAMKGLTGGSNPVTPTPAIVPILGPGFDLGIIGEVIRHGGDTFLTLGSLLAALQIDAESTIVMTPKLLTQDGRTSTIFQGNNIPFAGSFVSNSSPSGTGGTIGTTNIEYRDIGMSLTITPVLGNSDIVTLDINLDQTSTGQLNAASNQITLTNGLPTNISGITTSKTTMQTTVHVPDNHFLILSGMVNNSSIKTKTGMPCLGGLPFVGALFSRDDTSINNNSIVIFMRPHIVNSLDDITRITHEQELFFRDQAGTPYLEHAHNEAMELIKTVDDE